MWRVTCIEYDGSVKTITTDSEFYARERFRDYEIAKSCGYINDCKIERIEKYELPKRQR